MSEEAEAAARKTEREEEVPVQQLSSSFKLLQYRKTATAGTKNLKFDVDLG